MTNIVFRVCIEDKEFLSQCVQQNHTSISALMRRLIKVFIQDEELIFPFSLSISFVSLNLMTVLYLKVWGKTYPATFAVW